MHRLARFLAVAALLLSAACAGNQMQPSQAGDFLLDVVNPMPHPMNVSFSMGGVVTTLGTVEANSTKRFALPNRGGDEIEVIASDAGNTHKVEKPVDLESKKVARVTLSN